MRAKKPSSVDLIQLFDEIFSAWVKYEARTQNKEQKVWTLDAISRRDKFWYVSAGFDIVQVTYFNEKCKDRLIEKGIAFTKEEYAKEYAEFLRAFNVQYKKDQAQ